MICCLYDNTNTIVLKTIVIGSTNNTKDNQKCLNQIIEKIRMSVSKVTHKNTEKENVR